MRAMLLLLLLACASAPEPVEIPPVLLEPGPVHAVPERTEWPTKGWTRATPEEVGLDPAALQRLGEWSFRRGGDEVDRKGQRTNALVIVKDGKLVYERYARGYDADTPLLTWSVTKSFFSSVVGAAVQQGALDPNEPGCTWYTPMCERQAPVRVIDLLQMSSGIAWSETYETSPLFSSVMAMLYSRGPGDMAGFVASRPLAHWPGTRWAYSSGDSVLLQGVLKGALGDAYLDYPWTQVIEPLGMRHVTLEADRSGTYVGSSYLYAPAPELAKWAFLYLNDGVWDGRRILPEGWVKLTSTMAPAFFTTPVGPKHDTDNPSIQWYLNQGDPARGLERPWPALPPDAFAASGHWGKAVFVIPRWDMVVVRMGDDREYACTAHRTEGCNPDPEAAYDKGLLAEYVAAAVVTP